VQATGDFLGLSFISIGKLKYTPMDTTSSPVTDKKARQWAMLCHITGLAIFLGLPFGNIIVPLVIWLLKRETHPFVDEQGKEALNFQITVTLYGALAGLLCFLFIGFLILPILFIADIILAIKATLASDKGRSYTYPATIRFIK
jgi:uncharacterized protein